MLYQLSSSRPVLLFGILELSQSIGTVSPVCEKYSQKILDICEAVVTKSLQSDTVYFSCKTKYIVGTELFSITNATCTE